MSIGIHTEIDSMNNSKGAEQDMDVYHSMLYYTYLLYQSCVLLLTLISSS